MAARAFCSSSAPLPEAGARAGLTALVTAIARSGEGSVLSVLKRFGAQEGPVFLSHGGLYARP